MLDLFAETLRLRGPRSRQVGEPFFAVTSESGSP